MSCSMTAREPADLREDSFKRIVRKRAQNHCVDQTVYPNENPGLSPSSIFNGYSHLLSPFEKIEVKKYGKIYALSMNPETLKAPENAIEKDFFEMGSIYKMKKDEHIGYRYTIDKVIGQGCYGVVGEATDGKTKQKVAIRMVSKLAPRIYRETEMIMYISSIDPDHTFDCVRMLDYNVFRGFHYVVTDLFDTSVKKYIKEHHPNGIALENVAAMGRKILKGLVFLHEHNIVHGDLKPENIMLNLANPNDVKLGDFGLSRFAKPYHDHVQCQSMFYRAPEAFVRGRYNGATDMWSFGCTVAEMVSGKIFLAGDNCDDQFYLMQEVINIPPPVFFDTFYTNYYFFSTLKEAPKHIVITDHGPIVSFIYTKAADHRKIPGATPIGSFFTKTEQKPFNNFILKVFKWMPASRITAKQALDHPFFYSLSACFNQQMSLADGPLFAPKVKRAA
ncbi:Protein kinase domain-containing protein [Caenorhabditis elegans]|uniref:Protein kinase domain-containing protein n=1 Tax=Caenorhabditis elegans TaxID=6239 RepID=Q966P6_CAEEL|nr:Protein kinase domain-containing protein [Caenorhabditis elegans]CCD66841.2 Protein kinase domain-containing protein [Caenorhabditis elegans]|eukprot:NP_509198.2 Uncharacterized protein CELE_C36B7.2 [Caenorhabditis elegans]